MKGSLIGRLMYLFCALAGCLAGYGIFSLAGAGNSQLNNITEDNTLVRKMEDSVFFDGEQEKEQEVLPMRTGTAEQAATPTPREAERNPVLTKPEMPSATPTMEPEAQNSSSDRQVEFQEDSQAESEIVSGVSVEIMQETMPSLADQWVASGAVPLPPTPTPVSAAEETITYPLEIFGQVPVINRSDTYVSYFEFAYDLVTMMEPEVKQRGWNMNSLLMKFAVKALFCGVDIEKLDINDPIPRRLGALCLWLAAQVLEEAGSNTSPSSAGNYVIDISGCSAAERKAVAYLYEQGILQGYQMPGQKFYPDAGLQTETGNTWLSRVKQCWN